MAAIAQGEAAILINRDGEDFLSRVMLRIRI